MIDQDILELEALQKMYPRFREFFADCLWNILGKEATDMQLDIADFVAYGKKTKMVQAQRGEAKSTIAAMYVIWTLIHDPSKRIVVVAGTEHLAGTITGWCVKILTDWDILRCLRSKSNLDKARTTSYDVNNDLRMYAAFKATGVYTQSVNKDASIFARGITGSMTGFRADLIIADDIEAQNNSKTEGTREALLEAIKQFPALCVTGEILYLGTPQTSNSIYATLPSRGYDVRIWTGRYPTPIEEQNYGSHLAPFIIERMNNDNSLRYGGGLLGTRGKATDPLMVSEQKLQDNELDMGASTFQLQYMLDTKLSDAARYPLKLDDIPVITLPDTQAPVSWSFQKDAINKVKLPANFPVRAEFFRVTQVSELQDKFMGCYMYVDPAGGGKNGDETAWAITKYAAGKIFLCAIGAIKGGLQLDKLEALTAEAVKWKPTVIGIEKNFGNGALASVWQPLLLSRHRCVIEEPYETGQKELRIIDTLEPVIGSNRLVFSDRVFQQDIDALEGHPLDTRALFSLFHQLSLITRDRGSLVHDDRLDALAGSVRYWVNNLKVDSFKSRATTEDQLTLEFLSGYGNTHVKQKSPQQIARTYTSFTGRTYR